MLAVFFHSLEVVVYLASSFTTRFFFAKQIPVSFNLTHQARKSLLHCKNLQMEAEFLLD